MLLATADVPRSRTPLPPPVESGPRSIPVVDREALDTYRHLLTGRLVVTGRHDTETRRGFLLAPTKGTGDRRAINDMQREILLRSALAMANKHIALTLGVSSTSVSVLFQLAVARLQLTGRRDLADLARPGAATSPTLVLTGRVSGEPLAIRIPRDLQVEPHPEGSLLTFARARFQEPGFLSEAETEVVRCLAEGMTNADIARRRRVSIHTVANQARSAYVKLGIQSRLEVMALLLE